MYISLSEELSRMEDYSPQLVGYDSVSDYLSSGMRMTRVETHPDEPQLAEENPETTTSTSSSSPDEQGGSPSSEFLMFDPDLQVFRSADVFNLGDDEGDEDLKMLFMVPKRENVSDTSATSDYSWEAPDDTDPLLCEDFQSSGEVSTFSAATSGSHNVFPCDYIREEVVGEITADRTESLVVFDELLGGTSNVRGVVENVGEAALEMAFDADHSEHYDVNGMFDEVDGNGNHAKNVQIDCESNLDGVSIIGEASYDQPIICRPSRKRKATSTAETNDRKKTLRKRQTKVDSEGSVVNRRRRSMSKKAEALKKKRESFRSEIGPYLRMVAAVLDVSGIKTTNTAEAIPYELKRRFQPTDVCRTVFKSTLSSAEDARYCKPMIRLNEPDWKYWNETYVQKDCTESKSLTLETPDRLYYYCPYGLREEDSDSSVKEGCFISLLKDQEQDGKSNSLPVVLSSSGSALLNTTLDLADLAKHCANTEYKAASKSLLMRIKEPKCCALLFDSGKLIVLGTKYYEEFRVATRKFARIIQKAGCDVKLTNLKVHFYVGFVKLPFNINVKGLTEHEYLSQFTKYDLSMFPGVAIHVKTASVLCLVFETGEVLMADAPQPENMKTALDTIYPCLRQFGYTL